MANGFFESDAAYGLGGALGGLERGVNRGMQLAMQRQQMNEQAAYRQALAEQRKKAKEEAKTYPAGFLFGLDPSDPRYNIPVEEAKAGALVGQSISLSKPTTEEAKAGSQATEMTTLGERLSKQWEKFGFGTGEVKEAAKGVATRLLPGQISQRLTGPQFKEYRDTSAMLAEIALRAATGAATNPSEVSTYQGYLPEPGDLPAVARNKMENFFGRVMDRAEAHAKSLESRGFKEQAARHRRESIDMLKAQRDSMVSRFGKPPAGARPQAQGQPQDFSGLWQ